MSLGFHIQMQINGESILFQMSKRFNIAEYNRKRKLSSHSQVDDALKKRKQELIDAQEKLKETKRELSLLSQVVADAHNAQPPASSNVRKPTVFQPDSHKWALSSNESSKRCQATLQAAKVIHGTKLENVQAGL